MTDRNLQWFITCDINEIVDDKLAVQNKRYNVGDSCAAGDCTVVKDNPQMSAQLKISKDFTQW